jgi:putative ABC transport system permease protein
MATLLEPIVYLAWLIRREPLRLVLSLGGIVLGAAAIVFLASALSAARLALARMSQQATGADLSRVHAKEVFDGHPERVLSDADAAALREHEHLAAADISASSMRMGVQAVHGGVNAVVGLQSGGSTYAHLARMELLHGRWLAPEDENERRCMIGYDVWKEFFGSAWPLTDNTIILEGGVSLQVIGVFASRPTMGGNGGDGTFRLDKKVWVTQSTYHHGFDANGDAGEIVSRYPITQANELELIAKRLTPFFRVRHLGSKNFEFDALVKQEQTVSLVIAALGIVLFASGAIALIVGGVNIMNAQLVTVAERTREYGLRRALGASARSLQRSVLAESLTLSMAGGIFGTALGLGGAYGLSHLLQGLWGFWPFLVVTWSLVAALLASAFVGVVAGWLPAARASRLEPAVCLRDE